MAGDVILSGPVFNGRAAMEAHAYCRTTEAAIGQEAEARIKEYLPTQYKYLGHSGGNPQDNPVPPNAGFYESQIHAEQTAEGTVVTDDEVVYGPWLEGVSSRNEAYRFPGYGAFRQVGQQLEIDSLRIAETRLAPYLIAMNGGA